MELEMTDQEKPYLSYLLRLWLVQNQAHCSWRCSLENVQTGERHGFNSLDAMCTFLDEQIDPGLEDSQVDDVE